jgi:AcrR family transcriptional regulator
MNMKPRDTRDTLLKAASHVVVERGINQLTLEAVAQAAGISKGGLLYHFPSKEALIQGMVTSYLAGFEARLESKLEGEGESAWLKAYILASVDAPDEENAVGAALMAAVGINPDLLNPIRERYAVWQARVEAYSDPITATLIRLALDGLWLSDLMGFAPPSPEQRQRLLARLLDMIEK